MMIMSPWIALIWNLWDQDLDKHIHLPKMLNEMNIKQLAEQRNLEMLISTSKDNIIKPSNYSSMKWWERMR